MASDLAVYLVENLADVTVDPMVLPMAAVMGETKVDRTAALKEP